MIKTLPIIFCMLLIALVGSCDVRSEIAKKNMEKYLPSPTPPVVPAPTEAPIDPAESIEVDTALQGDPVSVDGHDQKKTTACPKFNRVVVNGDTNTIRLKGACRQIMINGDKNELIVDAAMEFVLNGSENIIRYSRFANGKRPTIIENRAGNIIEKISAQAATDNESPRKNTK